MNLFNPVVPPERFHPNFAKCLEKRNPYDEAVLSKWAEGFIDRDGKFVEEFQTTFNSCFWELYLHAILKEAGCKIDFKHNAPDFVVTDPVPFILEATVALNAKDSLPEWTPLDLKLRPKNLNEFNRVAMIRLLNSISEKSKKYEKSYRHLSHVQGKPFVLALTPFDQPFFYLEVQRAIEAVLYDYYVDEQEFLDDPSKFGSMKSKKLGVVKKNEKTDLPLGIFNDEKHGFISAVLFNSSATWGKVRALSEDPYPFIHFNALRSDPTSGDLFCFNGKKADYDETLFDGLKVYHNPHATFPLDWRVFQEPGAFQAVCVNPETQEFNFWMDRPPLAARNLITLNIRGAADIEDLEQKSNQQPKATWRQLVPNPEMLAKFMAGDDDEDSETPLASSSPGNPT
jgi:hypothetical protein